MTWDGFLYTMLRYILHVYSELCYYLFKFMYLDQRSLFSGKKDDTESKTLADVLVRSDRHHTK